MDLYYSERVAEIPLLVKEVKPGEKVVFDEQEQSFVDREIKSQQQTYYKGIVFPKEVAGTLWNGLAASKLRNLVRSRLASGDFKGAASTSIKVLGLFPFHDMDWLLLAEALVEQGDVVRSKAVLDYAKKLHKGYGQTKFTEAAWKEAFHRVQDIVKSKG